MTTQTKFTKIGYNGAVGGTEQTLAPGIAVDYVFPAGATSMSMRSSDNTDDKAGGQGALQVTIFYLDTNYAEQSLVVTLTGTTWVDIGTQMFRINNMRVSSTGTLGKPTGNITLADTATKAIIYGYISAGRNRQRQAVYTVPAGKVLYIQDFTASVMQTAGNKRTLITLYASYDDKLNVVWTNGKHFLGYYELTLGASAQEIISSVALYLPATTDVKINASSDGTSTVTASMRGWTEPSVVSS
jgi:hypothetical protein